MRQLATKAELSVMLRVSTRTIDRWRATGCDLGEVRTLGYPRFDVAKVSAMIDNGVIGKKPGRKRRTVPAG